MIKVGIAGWNAAFACAVLLIGLVATASAETYIPGESVDDDYGGFPSGFLVQNCVDCHSESDPAGDLALDELGPVDETNAATWRSVWAQVALKEMPPADADQPDVANRLRFSDWIVGQLTRVMQDKGGFHDHLDPNKGNFVDHELLFGPLPDDVKRKPTSSPARIWRVTPLEHVTRLNELINREPNFNPEAPGLRTRGDFVSTNHGGELKIYFGTDRIIQWQGGTVAYATSVKSVPSVLSSARNHGFENYPDFYTVNSAEAIQIMDVAGDIIRYMAEGPLSIANPYQITDDPKSIADKMKGDLRGLPTALVYSTKIKRPLTPVYDLMKEDGVTDERIRAAVDFLFESLAFRPPTETESQTYLNIVKQSIEKVGKKDGVVMGLSSIFLDRDALFRPELAISGTPDPHDRVMLQDWELAMAINHALRFLKPDEPLRTAVIEGKMRTRADVKREVERMLADDSIRKPRILRFIREYFDYDLGGYICKDAKALADTGASNRGQSHYRAMFDSTASTDRLIELILQEDHDVLKRLLTTDQVVATNADRIYFGRESSEEEKAASVAAERKAAKEWDARQTAKVDKLKKEIARLEKVRKDDAKNAVNRKTLQSKEKELETLQRRSTAEKRRRRSINHDVVPANLDGPKIFARVGRKSFGNGSLKPERILATVPEGERLGILTHPSWLVSHSDAMDNHAIRRGRWIRERLLGGGIPDVPITVDAMLPDEPESTLRERMRVTREDYCWTCHKKMDPLGLPFEQYNHAGLYRLTEQGEPVDTSGEIIESGDPDLDGKVEDAIEMISRIAESERAEQVFVRHAFRFWMGRNETLNDADVLQAAHRAYKDEGGSMKALLVSLLTSDAFLYRTR